MSAASTSGAGALPEDPGLEASIRRTSRPEARPAFREGLREAFLAGRSGESSSRGLEGRRTDQEVSQELERTLARTALAPPAREGFRADLRRRFVTGDFVAKPVATPAGRLLRLVVPLAAAAAILAVAFLLPDGPRWGVRIEGEGPVQVAGVRLDASDRARIEVELSLGAELRTGDNTVWMTLEDALVLEVRPQTSLTVAALPDREAGAPYRFELERGETFLRTLDGFGGRELLVDTPQAEVRVMGTALGVLANDEGTCVCVAAGDVIVTVPDGGHQALAARQTYFVFDEPARAPMLVEFDSAHQAHTDPLRAFTNGN